MQKFVRSISREPYAPPGLIFGMWVGLGPKVRMVTLMEVKGQLALSTAHYVVHFSGLWTKDINAVLEA